MHRPVGPNHNEEFADGNIDFLVGLILPQVQSIEWLDFGFGIVRKV
jgi:hypothetical protein